MAFSKGQESSFASKKYIGVASVNIVGINPTKEELSVIYNREMTKDQNYLTPTGIRLDFVIKANPEDNNGIDMITHMPIFLSNEARTNAANTKVQVIDPYGRTAWVTREEYKVKSIPIYGNGVQARITNNYRACYRGEEELTECLRTFLGIPSMDVYKDGKWTLNSHPEDCYARVDSINDILKGDISEIITAWNLRRDNKFKVLVGIRTAPNGTLYQTVYTRMFLHNRINKYDRLEDNLKRTIETGAYANCEFAVEPLKEYVVKATNLEEVPKVESPFIKDLEDDDMPF